MRRTRKAKERDERSRKERIEVKSNRDDVNREIEKGEGKNDGRRKKVVPDKAKTFRFSSHPFGRVQLEGLDKGREVLLFDLDD